MSFRFVLALEGLPGAAKARLVAKYDGYPLHFLRLFGFRFGLRGVPGGMKIVMFAAKQDPGTPSKR